jgi:four helix bundle protein
VDEQEFKRRRKDIAVRILTLVESLPRSTCAFAIARQIVRSGTSIGSNYRAACRAISRADLIAKLGHVEEEADETLYWMELLIERKIVTAQKLQPLMSDVNEVLAMTVASIQTLRRVKIQNPKSKI